MTQARPVHCHSRTEDGLVRPFDAAFSDANGVQLDSVASLLLAGAHIQQHHNYLSALTTLALGLEFLFLQHQAHKAHFVASQDPIWGNPIATYAIVPNPVLASMYHWYAVTAWNYIRGIGYLAESLGLLPKAMTGLAYARSVSPTIGTFRDKMGAHTSAFSGNQKDSLADRLTSLNVGMTYYANGTIFFPAGVFGFRDQPASTIAPWSIEIEHHRLYARYWSRPGELNADGMPTILTRIYCSTMSFAMQFS